MFLLHSSLFSPPSHTMQWQLVTETLLHILFYEKSTNTPQILLSTSIDKFSGLVMLIGVWLLPFSSSIFHSLLVSMVLTYWLPSLLISSWFWLVSLLHIVMESRWLLWFFCVSYCIILVYLYTLDHRINIRVKPVGNGRCVHAKSYCIPPLLLLLLSSLSREHRMYNIFTRHQISTHLEWAPQKIKDVVK